MPLFRMKHRSQVTVQLFCLVLLNGLLHVQHLYPNRLFPEPDLDHVPGLDIQGSLGRLVVHKNASGVAGLVGDSPALDQTGNLQKLVQSHGLVVNRIL